MFLPPLAAGVLLLTIAVLVHVVTDRVVAGYRSRRLQDDAHRTRCLRLAAVRRLLTRLAARVATAEDDLRRLRTRAAAQDRRRRTIERTRPQDDRPVTVRVLNGGAGETWAVLLVNRHVADRLAAGDDHIHYDRSWARPQTVLVTAPTSQAASRTVEAGFPRALGFTLARVERAGDRACRLLERLDGRRQPV